MILQKFFPKTLVKINSPINGEISVVEQFGKRKIVVAGLTQSGPMAEKVWEPAVKDITSHISHATNILILGLGGGSLVKLLSQNNSKAKIVGVEIDPIMINLGKKYLGLGEFKNLKIIISNANSFVKETKEIFDLIFVDLYLGENIPKNCQNEKFLQNLKKILDKNGIVVFNRLYYKNHIFEAKKFLDKLQKIFNDLDCQKVLTNLLILVRR